MKALHLARRSRIVEFVYWLDRHTAHDIGTFALDNGLSAVVGPLRRSSDGSECWCHCLVVSTEPMTMRQWYDVLAPLEVADPSKKWLRLSPRRSLNSALRVLCLMRPKGRLPYFDTSVAVFGDVDTSCLRNLGGGAEK